MRRSCAQAPVPRHHFIVKEQRVEGYIFLFPKLLMVYIYCTEYILKYIELEEDIHILSPVMDEERDE
jgi:hypothetical protein